MEQITVFFMVLGVFGLGVAYGRYTYWKKALREGREFIESLKRNAEYSAKR